MGAASLNHKPINDSVEGAAIIKLTVSQFFKIGNSVWRYVIPEFYRYVSLTGFNENLVFYFVAHKFKYLLQLE
jgi:hypothetical protein